MRAHALNHRAAQSAPTKTHSSLRDFTAGWRVLLIPALAILLGSASALLALALLRVIGLFTNLFFFGRFRTALVSPADSSVGIFIVVIPILGAFVVGVAARFGSEHIRGQGIPEAIEAILINGSRV